MDKSNLLMAKRIISEYRAAECRVIEYLRSMCDDTGIEERFSCIDSMEDGYDKDQDIKDTEDIMNHLDANGDEDYDTEVDRILNAKSDISFDEMIGIKDDVDKLYESAFMDLYTEDGLNAEYIYLAADIRTKTKKEITELKRNFKAKKYSAAKMNVENLKKIYEESEKALKKIEATYNPNNPIPVGLGNLIYVLMEYLIITLTTIISVQLGGGFLVASLTKATTYAGLSIRDLIKHANQLCRDIKRHEFNIKSFNVWRSEVIMVLENTRRVLDYYTYAIDELCRDDIAKEYVLDNSDIDDWDFFE